MKKKFTKIISMIACLVLCITCFVACGNKDWSKNVTLNEYDATASANSNGGFVVERGDYVYFVNGVQNYATENKFGEPIKGALMVAKKDLSKVEILLPKIIASGDYTAGIYVFGDYVYYATPSTTKTGSGVVNYNDLVFARTKLDGSKTEEFLTVTGNTTMFRYAEVSGNVYLYYVAENAINQYAVSTKETSEIANVEGAETKEYANLTLDYIA